MWFAGWKFCTVVSYLTWLIAIEPPSSNCTIGSAPGWSGSMTSALAEASRSSRTDLSGSDGSHDWYFASIRSLYEPVSPSSRTQGRSRLISMKSLFSSSASSMRPRSSCSSELATDRIASARSAISGTPVAA